MRVFDRSNDAPVAMTKQEKLRHCAGCYNDGYNHGLGGAVECWSLDGAKLISRKRVDINHVPPWNHKPDLYLSCRREAGYVFVKPDAIH